MTDKIMQEAEARMAKARAALGHNFNRIRTGRAHPSLLDDIRVDYYGAETPLNQMANIVVEDPRTLAVTAWDKTVVPEIEKAIRKSELGLNPAAAGEVIRIPMPPLTEETRKGYIRQAKGDAEAARVSVRNARRDAIAALKALLKDKELSEDGERRAHEAVQKLTDRFIKEIEEALAAKEADLIQV